MKNCTNCKYAEWKRTEAGRLHPSKDGKCMYPWKLPALPASMHWISSPAPCGGYINRGRDNAEHCAYFARAEAKGDSNA